MNECMVIPPSLTRVTGMAATTEFHSPAVIHHFTHPYAALETTCRQLAAAAVPM